jgi:hypothetical protein
MSKLMLTVQTQKLCADVTQLDRAIKRHNFCQAWPPCHVANHFQYVPAISIRGTFPIMEIMSPSDVGALARLANRLDKR